MVLHTDTSTGQHKYRHTYTLHIQLNFWGTFDCIQCLCTAIHAVHLALYNSKPNKHPIGVTKRTNEMEKTNKSIAKLLQTWVKLLSGPCNVECKWHVICVLIFFIKTPFFFFRFSNSIFRFFFSMQFSVLPCILASMKIVQKKNYITFSVFCCVRIAIEV